MRLIEHLCVKLVQNINSPVEQCGHIFCFRKRPGCALTGACAPIRKNMVLKCSENVLSVLMVLIKIVLYV